MWVYLESHRLCVLPRTTKELDEGENCFSTFRAKRGETNKKGIKTFLALICWRIYRDRVANSSKKFLEIFWVGHGRVRRDNFIYFVSSSNVTWSAVDEISRSTTWVDCADKSDEASFCHEFWCGIWHFAHVNYRTHRPVTSLFNLFIGRSIYRTKRSRLPPFFFSSTKKTSI